MVKGGFTFAVGMLLGLIFLLMVVLFPPKASQSAEDLEQDKICYTICLRSFGEGVNKATYKDYIGHPTEKACYCYGFEVCRTYQNQRYCSERDLLGIMVRQNHSEFR